MTRVENLASLVMKGIIPGGGEGGRDHVFFGEYAPWDELNMSTLTYLGPDTKFTSCALCTSKTLAQIQVVCYLQRRHCGYGNHSIPRSAGYVDCRDLP